MANSVKINEPRFYPLLVSENGSDTNMPLQEHLSVWQKFDRLPQIKKDIITSPKMPQKLKQLQEQFRLPDPQLILVSLLIRKYFLGELAMPDLESRVKGLNGNQGGEILSYIQKEIFTIQPEPKAPAPGSESDAPATRNRIQMPLLNALSKYEQLAAQQITKERIRLKGQPEPARPSLVNWLRYYRDELGVGHHNSIERGNFLFRSDNGRKLSPEERERLNLILKSVEENLPLTIDVDRSEIVFPSYRDVVMAPQRSTPVSAAASGPRVSFEAAPPRPTLTPELAFKPEGAQDQRSAVGRIGRGMHFGNMKPNTAPAPSNGLSFSSNHVFQAEKERPKTPPAASQDRPNDMNPFHIRPVSLEKEE